MGNHLMLAENLRLNANALLPCPAVNLDDPIMV